MLHRTTFEYLQPTDAQFLQMARLRVAAKAYADVLDAELIDGPDKNFILRSHRINAAWVDTVVLRRGDGAPRD